MSSNGFSRCIRGGLPVAAALLSIGGCGGANAPPAEPSATDRALLESAERPLQRARAAETISGERKADLDQKLDQVE